MILHIVLFQPKQGLSVDERLSFAQFVIYCAQSAPTVMKVTVGRSVPIDAGYARSFGDMTYEYAAVLEFDDEAGLIAYLRDPVHQKLGEMFWRFCERTVVSEVRTADLTDPSAANKLAE